MTKEPPVFLIHCIPVEVSSSGSLIGKIWIETGGLSYPWSEYADTLSELICHWLDSVANLFSGERTQELWFWDKPFYYLVATRAEGETCQLVGQDKEGDVYFDTSIGLKHLRKEVLKAANQVLAFETGAFSLREEILHRTKMVRQMDAGRVISTAATDAEPKTSWANASEEDLRQATLRSGKPGLRDSYGMSALHVAAYRGWVDLACELVDEGVDLEARGNCWWAEDDGGLAPLHMAAWGGNPELVRLLLARGADPNCRDRNGSTPLHYAAFAGDLDSVKHLVDAKATISARDVQHRTAIDIADDEDNDAVVDFLRRLNKGN